jgi:hypothetical protein
LTLPDPTKRPRWRHRVEEGQDVVKQVEEFDVEVAPITEVLDDPTDHRRAEAAGSGGAGVPGAAEVKVVARSLGGG